MACGSRMGGCAGQVLSIDGAPTDGWDGDRAAKVLRGKSGSSVTVKFARRTEQIPGVAGRPEPPPMMEYKQVPPPPCAPPPSSGVTQERMLMHGGGRAGFEIAKE